MAEIDRQVRSGNLLYNPTSETGTIDPFGVAASGYMFRVYTQAKFSPNDDPRCSLWVIDDEQRLLYRWWPVLDPDAATEWRVIAEGIVNRNVSSPAFTLDATGRTVTVSLKSNADYAARPERDPDVQGSRSPDGTPRSATRTTCALTCRATCDG